MRDLVRGGAAALPERANTVPRAAVATGVAAKCAEAATLLVLVTVVPRALGPADYGIFALALSVVTVGSAAVSVGASPMLARFVPAATASERTAVARALGARLVRRRLPVTAIAAVAALALAAAFPATFPPLATALVAVAFVLDVAATLCFQLALGLGRFRAWSFRYPVQNGVLTLAAILLAAALGGTGALIAVTVAAAGALSMGMVVGALPLRGTVSAAVIPSGAAQFGRSHAIASFMLLVAHRGGIVVVAIVAGTRETGYAGLAIGVGLAALYAVHQIFLLQLAALSERVDDDLAAAERAARRLAEQALLVLAPVAVVVAVALEPLLAAVFGPEFADARTSFVPILALLPLIPLAALGSQLASLTLKPQAMVTASGAALAVFVATAPAGVLLWGGPGGPASLLACTVGLVVVLSMTLDLAERRFYVAAAASSAAALAIGLLG